MLNLCRPTSNRPGTDGCRPRERTDRRLPGGHKTPYIIDHRRKSSMAAPAWNISGQYFETCSCDYLCPCILGQMAVRPTKGSCTFAMAMQVERGTFGSVPLGGVTFIVLGYTPEELSLIHISEPTRPLSISYAV